MTATSPVPAARTGVGAQLARFIAVGAVSALVDFGVYQLLLHLGLWVHAAKAISFILGTTTAYLLNRRFTFTSSAGGRTTITSVRSAALEKPHNTSTANAKANAAAPIRYGTRTDRLGSASSACSETRRASASRTGIVLVCNRPARSTIRNTSPASKTP